MGDTPERERGVIPKMMAEFRDGGVVGSQGIFFRMEFVVAGPI
jgi:hypothetical protein